MDAGELGANLSDSYEEDLSAELRGVQECSNSDEDSHFNDKGKLLIIIHIK